MPKFTTFLNLTLPELNEFVDSWNDPLNQNLEDVDDWLSDLYENLVGTGTGSTWASLRGSLNSLADRLDISINPDGTIDVSGSSEILDMATSSSRGSFTSPRDRLNDTDREIYEARQPAADGRFASMALTGPSAGFPYEELDAGIAVRSADFGRTAAQPISSPQRPWAPGLVVGGDTPLIAAAGGTNDVVIKGTAGSNAAIFNIDGYIFRLREQILFDFALIPSLSSGDYVWIYVSRNETDYTSNTTFKYSEIGGTPAAKDLRKLKTGTDGVTSNSTFSSATGTWDTAPFKVKEGDVLVIEGIGSAAGEYVIDALDGTTPNTKLTIKGKFKANASGLTYHVKDRFMPHIGAAIAAVNPNLASSQPPSVAGRVYIGRVIAGAPVTGEVVFASGGVYDSGWLSITNMSGAGGAPDFPLSIAHNLGVVPSSIEVLVRESSTVHRVYAPVVERSVVTKMDSVNFPNPNAADTSTSTLLLPSLRWDADEANVTIRALNATADPVKANALFTDSGGTDKTTGEIRVVVRR